MDYGKGQLIGFTPPSNTEKNRSIVRQFVAILFFGLLLVGCGKESPKGAVATFSISVSDSLIDAPLDGRLLLMLADNPDTEPRFQISAGLSAQPVFGMNVDQMKAGESQVFDGEVFGFPYASLADLPPGDYWVQGLLHIYETFNLSTGQTVKLPMDQGEGQQWNRSPGNLYSRPVKITIPESGRVSFDLVLDQKIAPIEEAKDTEWIKHIKIKSEKLSAFWGRDMYLGAHVLLPKGFDEHPEARYPLMVFHGHFPSDFGGFRTTPPDEDMEDDFSERFQVKGYNRIQQQEAYDFYQRWNEPDFPRFLIIQIQHPTPYYGLAGLVEKARLRAINKLADIQPNDSVLEIGCEAGNLMLSLPQASRMVGFDISQKALDVAEQSFQAAKRSAEFVFGNGEEPLPLI